MTGEPQNSIAPHNPDEVLQFAPNFTVYVLPSDILCLYSEDRKFLLHGTLYCAIGALLAEGERSARDLIEVLEPYFPADQINEAIKRLLDRNYAVPKPGFANAAVGAYWSSLGLPPIEALKNLLRVFFRNARAAINKLQRNKIYLI